MINDFVSLKVIEEMIQDREELFLMTRSTKPKSPGR